MNTEFHTKISSAISGLTAAARPKSSSTEINELKDKTSHFKDMLNRSIKDPEQPVKEKAALPEPPIKELVTDEKLTARETEETVEDSAIENELTAVSSETGNPLIIENENDLKNLLQSNAMGFTMQRTNLVGNGSFENGNLDETIEAVGINQPGNIPAEKTNSALQGIQNTEMPQSQQNANIQGSVEVKSFSELTLKDDTSDTENSLKSNNEKQTNMVVADNLSTPELNTIGEIPINDRTDKGVGLENDNSKESENTGKNTENTLGLADQTESQNPLESSQPMLQGTEQSAVGKTATEQEPIRTEDKNDGSSKEIQGIAFANVISDKGTGIQPNNTVELSGQIEKEVLSQLDKNKPVKFMMSLEPGNLGKIDIELKFDQGKLTIDITAFSKETQNLLSAQVDKLVKSLALQNVHVENVQLNMQSQDRMNTDAKTIMMNMGMDFTQGQKHGLLKENIMNQNNRTKNGSLEIANDVLVNDLKTAQISSYGNRRINYLV